MEKQGYLLTERLVLRAFERKDASAAHDYASHPVNVRFMPWGPNTGEDSERFVRECMEKQASEPRKDYDFAVTLKEKEGGAPGAGRLIGGCGISLNEAGDTGMLGWIPHRDFWRQGLTAGALIRLGFETRSLRRIYAACNVSRWKAAQPYKAKMGKPYVSACLVCAKPAEKEKWRG